MANQTKNNKRARESENNVVFDDLKEYVEDLFDDMGIVWSSIKHMSPREINEVIENVLDKRFDKKGNTQIYVKVDDDYIPLKNIVMIGVLTFVSGPNGNKIYGTDEIDPSYRLDKVNLNVSDGWKNPEDIGEECKKLLDAYKNFCMNVLKMLGHTKGDTINIRKKRGKDGSLDHGWRSPNGEPLKIVEGMNGPRIHGLGLGGLVAVEVTPWSYSKGVLFYNNGGQLILSPVKKSMSVKKMKLFKSKDAISAFERLSKTEMGEIESEEGDDYVFSG